MTIEAQSQREWRRQLAGQPDRIEAWRALGHLHVGMQDFERSHRDFRRAIAIQLPGLGALEEAVGLQLARNNLREAAILLQAGLRYAPARADWWNNLGVCAAQLAQSVQAPFRVAICIDPANPEYTLNLAYQENAAGQAPLAHVRARRVHLLSPMNAGALILIALKGGAAAARPARQALALAPALGDGWKVLATVLAQEKVVHAARLAFVRAIALAPTDAMVLSNFAEANRLALRLQDAGRAARRGIVLAPAMPQAHGNLALIRQDEDAYPESMMRLDRALALSPHDRQLLVNRTVALKAMGRFDEAIALLSGLVAREPRDAMAQFMLGTGLLSLGRLSEAWPHFDCRLGPLDTAQSRLFGLPLWDGTAKAGRLLVWGEQGLGDELIFGSMLPDLVRRGVKAVVECDPRLVTIFARSFPTFDVVPRSEPPHPMTLSKDIYAQTPMGSLARWLRPGASAFPSDETGFLVPDPARRQFWRERLAELPPGLRVGIAWRSGRKDPIAVRNSTRLVDWRPVLMQEGIVPICLQYGEIDDELAEIERLCGRSPIRFEGLDLFNDIEGGLALGAELDLVVSPATSATTIAASTGTPMLVVTWPDAWALCGQDCFPWFTASRAYRRRHGEGWGPAIERISEELRRRRGARDAAREGRTR